MRKALIVISILIFSIASWVVYDHIVNFQHPTVNVKISEFEWESGFTPYIGLTLVNTVNVTIQNVGSNDVSNLSLTVRLLYNDSELANSRGFTKRIEMLHAQESLTISEWVFSYLGIRPVGAKCVTTLMKDQVVLDERVDSIVWE